MKKILIATNVLLLATVGFLAYKLSLDTIRSPQGGAYVVAEQPLSDTIDGLIGGDLAVVMSQAFRDDEKKSMMGKVGIDKKPMEDTRSVLFNLETIKSFIREIENAIPAKVRPKLGLRIYFAKYPDSVQKKMYHALDDLSPALISNRVTVFMVPAYRKDSTSDYIDFNFNYLGDNKHQPTPYYKLLRDPSIQLKPGVLGGFNKRMDMYYAADHMPTSALDVGMAARATEEAGSLNHGGMAPPPAKSGTFPMPQSEEPVLIRRQ